MDRFGQRHKIFEEIELERRHQEEKFLPVFDDKNTVNDWVSYIVSYAGNSCYGETIEEQRRYMVKVASIAVAAIEACDRNKGFPPRFYDPSKDTT